MKSSLAVVAVVLTVAIAGCDNRAESPAASTATVPSEADEPSAVPSPPSVAITPPVSAASDGVPAFAAIYPDAQIEGEPVVAGGPSGPGGMTTFTTDAEPEAVIAFYRERAEADGLSKIMSMSRGDVRAYGAQEQTTGASVNVVASPADDKTSVQLTWSAGQ